MIKKLKAENEEFRKQLGGGSTRYKNLSNEESSIKTD